MISKIIAIYNNFFKLIFRKIIDKYNEIAQLKAT